MNNIGKKRHRLAIQSNTATRDATGQAIETWSTLFIVWAEITPLSAREQSYANQSGSIANYSIKTRYREQITASMRGLQDGRIFNFEGVTNPDGVKSEMVIAAIHQATGAA